MSVYQAVGHAVLTHQEGLASSTAQNCGFPVYRCLDILKGKSKSKLDPSKPEILIKNIIL